jgi:ElaB/YqjD/DUF883 family membrane-anchored ribosome-binding protein
MADVQSSTRTPQTGGGTATTPQQESRNAEQRREERREAGREVGNEALQTAQNLTAEGKAVASEYYEQGRERMLAWQQQLENQVREKPLQSLLMAAGIGLLFGLLKRR